MSKIDDYRSNLQKHNDMLSDIEKYKGENPQIHPKLIESLNLRNYNTGDRSYKGWANDRLRAFASTVTNNKINEIIAEAIRLSEESLAKLKEDAQNEAIELLKS